MTLVRDRRAGTSSEHLVLALARGDLSSLGALFDRHARDVGRFVARLGVRQGNIEDLVQQTFLAVPRASANYRGGDVRAWLLGLAANLVRRHRRSLSRTAARIAAWAREWHADAPPTPGEDLDRREAAARALRALDRLSAKKREVFVLVAMEGVAVEHAAMALGIPIGTVWTRLHHARRELRQLLAREDT